MAHPTHITILGINFIMYVINELCYSGLRLSVSFPSVTNTLNPQLKNTKPILELIDVHDLN